MSNELAKFTVKVEVLIQTEKYTNAIADGDEEKAGYLEKAGKQYEWVDTILPIDLNKIDSISKLTHKGLDVIAIQEGAKEVLVKYDKYTWDIICSSSCLVCSY